MNADITRRRSFKQLPLVPSMVVCRSFRSISSALTFSMFPKFKDVIDIIAVI